MLRLGLGGDRVQGLGDAALDADGHRVVGVHFGHGPVDVQDFLVAVGAPAGRRVLDQVIADRDHQVRLVETEIRVIMHHEAESPQGLQVVVGEYPFAEKCGRDGEV